MTEDTAERILAAVGETKGEIIGLTQQVSVLAQQVATQNGNVKRLNEWRRDVELRDARNAGIVEGRTGLRRTQVAVLTGAVTAGASIIGTAAGIIARFVG